MLVLPLKRQWRACQRRPQLACCQPIRCMRNPVSCPPTARGGLCTHRINRGAEYTKHSIHFGRIPPRGSLPTSLVSTSARSLQRGCAPRVAPWPCHGSGSPTAQARRQAHTFAAWSRPPPYTRGSHWTMRVPCGSATSTLTRSSSTCVLDISFVSERTPSGTTRSRCGASCARGAMRRQQHSAAPRPPCARSSSSAATWRARARRHATRLRHARSTRICASTMRPRPPAHSG